MTAIRELEAALEEISALKAPGVRRELIESITALCMRNIKSESVLLQRIFSQFKRNPTTHKLGIVYVVDSVVRQWSERARVNGEDATAASATDGTFAAGVRRVVELLPTMFTELVNGAPEDQEARIGKLIDIWERGNNFPPTMLADFRTKLSARFAHKSPTVTPAARSTILPAQHRASAPHMAQNSTPQGSTNGQQNMASLLQGLVSLPMPQAVAHNAPAPVPQVMPAVLPLAPPAQQQAVALLYQPSDVIQHIPPEIMSNELARAQRLSLLEKLVNLRVPANQWGAVIKLLDEGALPHIPSGSILVARPAQSGPPVAQTGPPIVQSGPPVAYSVPPVAYTGPPMAQSGPPVAQSGPSPAQSRPRSRSPTRRRHSPTYENYRQRSPIRSGGTSVQDDQGTHRAAKWTDVDLGLRPGHIKGLEVHLPVHNGEDLFLTSNIVLSRTLFVGGVNCSENELRQIFARFGRVQSCIVNLEKRHAFVKMCSRDEAVAAKTGIENLLHDEEVSSKARSVRWGVGFGPRDCTDYATGEGIIPIERLTEADLKWVADAEYGGTGGKPLVTGLVMEEPDIEIGAGISSKAISARRPGPGGSGHDLRRSNVNNGSNDFVHGGATNGMNDEFRNGSSNDFRRNGGTSMNQGNGHWHGSQSQSQGPGQGLPWSMFPNLNPGGRR